MNVKEQADGTSDEGKRRVLIVDDHPVFRHGITALINASRISSFAARHPPRLLRLRP
jgi:hypothetical protein